MLARKVMSASAVLSGFSALGRLLELASTLIVARIIAPEQFGIVAAALVTYQLIVSFTEVEILSPLIQKDSLSETDYGSALTVTVARGLIIMLGVCLASFLIANMIDDQRVIPVLCVLGLTQIFYGWRSPKVVKYARAVNLAPPAIADFIARFSGFLTTVIIGVLTGSYWAIAIGMVTTGFVGMIGTYVIAPYLPRFSTKGIGWILSFSGWLTAANIAMASNAQLDRFLVGGLLGKSPLGIYTLGTSLAHQASWSLAAPIMNALFDGFSRISGELDRLQNAYLRAQNALIAIMFPVGIGIAAIAEPLVLFLLGPEWKAVAGVIAIVSPAIALSMMVVGAQSLALSLARPRLLFNRNVIALFFGVPAAVAGAILFGLEGAAWARASSGLLVIGLNLWMAKHLIGVSIVEQVLNCWRSLVSGLVMGVSVYLTLQSMPEFTQSISGFAVLLVTAGFGALLYLSVHFLLWAIAGQRDGIERLVLSAFGTVFRKFSTRAGLEA